MHSIPILIRLVVPNFTGTQKNSAFCHLGTNFLNLPTFCTTSVFIFSQGTVKPVGVKITTTQLLFHVFAGMFIFHFLTSNDMSFILCFCHPKCIYLTQILIL